MKDSSLREYRITKPNNITTADFERSLQFLQGRYKDVNISTAQPNKHVLKIGA